MLRKVYLALRTKAGGGCGNVRTEGRSTTGRAARLRARKRDSSDSAPFGLVIVCAYAPPAIGA